MVLLNTHTVGRDDLAVRYLLNIPASECLFGSTREKSTGKSRLFLAFNDGKVYARNGLADRWEEITSVYEALCIRELFTEALRDQSVPCYTTDTRFKLESFDPGVLRQEV